MMAGRGFTRIVTPIKTRAFENEVAVLAKAFWRGRSPLAGALMVSMEFVVRRPPSVKRHWPSVRPDLDNYVKAICDALNGVFWKDDAQIVKLLTTKRYGDQGSIIVKLMEVPDNAESVSPPR